MQQKQLFLRTAISIKEWVFDAIYCSAANMSQQIDMIMGSEEQVQSILERKLQGSTLYYQVAWKGYPLSQATWQPIHNLANCKKLIAKFEKERKLTHSQVALGDSQITSRKRRPQGVGEQVKGRKVSNRKKPQQGSRVSEGRLKMQSIMDNNLKERKEKEEEIKQRLTKYSQNLQGKAPNHQMQQINEIYKAVLKLSEMREREFGGQPLLQKDGNVRHLNWSQRIYRYSKCDEGLKLQKRLTLRNILKKEGGVPTTKQRIKMVEVEDIEVFNQEFRSVRRVERESPMDKLEMLIKLRYSWVAVGKNKRELFLMDVNLLEEPVWRAIEDLFQH